MKQITAIIRDERLNAVKDALASIDCKSLTVTEVKGRGEQLGITESYRGNEYRIDLLTKVEIMTVVHDKKVPEVIKVICEAAKTGKSGDGKIFVQNVEDVIRIRTGEHGDIALD